MSRKRKLARRVRRIERKLEDVRDAIDEVLDSVERAKILIEETGKSVETAVAEQRAATAWRENEKANKGE
jgi:hypothetical protein